MGRVPRRLVKRIDLVTDFLEFALQHDACAVTVIVSSTKQVFLQKLRACIQLQMRNQESTVSPEETAGSDSTQTTAPHSLLSNAIETLARSQRVTLAFCPSLEHLRAKLAVFHTSQAGPGKPQENGAYQGRPMLAIVDPLALHDGDSELSAQGLSRTLALAVEVAAREHVDIVLCESRDPDSASAASGPNLWDVNIPLLNPSRDVAAGGRRADGHRTVRAKHVAKRWFDFDKQENIDMRYTS